MGEVMIHAEGTLSLVQASASGGAASGARVWATASAPQSAMNVAYVTQFSYTSARQIATKMNRGVPTHHKFTQSDPIQVSMTVEFTGSFTGFATAEGASTNMAHGELKLATPGVGESAYFQFHGIAVQQVQFTENVDGDTMALTLVALGMTGPTASGYLS